MNIFNRRQLISTYNLKQVNQIKEMLNANGIKFYITTHNRKGDDLFLSVGRGHQGTAFEKMEYECTYKIYVHKDDYEAANSMVRGELW